jgi:hypothetical protein
MIQRQSTKVPLLTPAAAWVAIAIRSCLSGDRYYRQIETSSIVHRCHQGCQNQTILEQVHGLLSNKKAMGGLVIKNAFGYYWLPAIIGIEIPLNEKGEKDPQYSGLDGMVFDMGDPNDISKLRLQLIKAFAPEPIVIPAAPPVGPNSVANATPLILLIILIVKWFARTGISRDQLEQQRMIVCLSNRSALIRAIEKALLQGTIKQIGDQYFPGIVATIKLTRGRGELPEELRDMIVRSTYRVDDLAAKLRWPSPEKMPRQEVVGSLTIIHLSRLVRILRYIGKSKKTFACADVQAACEVSVKIAGNTLRELIGNGFVRQSKRAKKATYTTGKQKKVLLKRGIHPGDVDRALRGNLEIGTIYSISSLVADKEFQPRPG